MLVGRISCDSWVFAAALVQMQLVNMRPASERSGLMVAFQSPTHPPARNNKWARAHFEMGFGSRGPGVSPWGTCKGPSICATRVGFLSKLNPVLVSSRHHYHNSMGRRTGWPSRRLLALVGHDSPHSKKRILHVWAKQCTFCIMVQPMPEFSSKLCHAITLVSRVVNASTLHE